MDGGVSEDYRECVRKGLALVREGQSKLLRCERNVIAFSALGRFCKEMQQNPSELRSFRAGLAKLPRIKRVMHIISAPLFHGTDKVVEQGVWVHRTRPLVRTSMIKAVAAECAYLYWLFGDIHVTPVHFFFRNNELDHKIDVPWVDQEFRKQFGDACATLGVVVQQGRLDNLVIVSKHHQSITTPTVTFAELMNRIPVDMIYASGGQTHWLNSVMFQNGVHEVLYDRPDVIWSGSSAGIICGGVTTLLSALKCNYLGTAYCDDVKSALRKDSTQLCSEAHIGNACVFRKCEFDGIGAFNGVFLPHYQHDNPKLHTTLANFFAELPNNTIVGRDFVRTRLGGHFVGQVVPLVDGECMLCGSSFRTPIRLPVTPSRAIAYDAHFARQTSDISSYCMSHVLRMAEKPVGSCRRPDTCPRPRR
jgi:hypothetical protein